MAYVTGEVVPVQGEAQPFKVVFRHTDDGKVIAEWPCASVSEGEAQIVETLLRLKNA